ncbi:pca operon transcription factor PcaQ [Mameliella sp. AT18]|uniref:pca operon transcription factor PcaQ n=1 Tax=Mameliella sp. AT18 TaxID=3028385 RepID=UPI00084118D4|nr:pca operon transcription factor PcaQ [Mameliella sp. AT18]MDD9731017.1 pca operon transcription factor PcaQ [Mameliella sp. AT18]ODM47457.1 pca operon transcription factor PcaQ [Ruegeria sp. PBVC088]
MDNRIKQRHLTCFLEIVRSGSIIAAAHQLNITQSAASRTLGELEEIINARLMERNRAGIVLTSAGETFYRHVSASVTALKQGLEQIARTRKDARQSVIVGVLPNAAERVLPTAVARFKARNPGCPVSVVTGTNPVLMQALRVGELDFVIGRLAAPDDMAGIDFQILYQEQLAAVVRPGHPLLVLELHEEFLASLAEQTFVIPLADTIIRRDAEQLLIAAGVKKVADVVETVSSPFARAYCLQTDAVWIAPWGAVEGDLRSGVLSALAVDAAATQGNVGISTRSESGLTPLARSLAAELQDVASDTVQKSQVSGRNQL